jgi:hypothetical protein
MGRPRKFNERKQVSFSVDEAESKWIELQAGGNVSQWCREVVLADMPTGVAEVAAREPKKVGIVGGERGVKIEESAAKAKAPERSLGPRDLCGNELCRHFRFEHRGNYCVHGDCRCGGFQ